MKTFRLIGMALFAIAMSVNFTSCSSDDEEELIKNEEGVITNQKRLIRFDRNGYDTSEFTYDNDGKLLSVTNTFLHSDGRKDINTYTITWGANKIIENRYRHGEEEVVTYTFKDGLITHQDYRDLYNHRNVVFTYNSNKQLIYEDEEDEDGYTSYTWQGEKLAKSTGQYIYEFSYSGKTCKGYFPIMVWYVNDLSPLMEAHPELVGMRRNQLPDQIYFKDGSYEEIAKYTYTFDKDGYIESCTEVEKNFPNADTYTDIYTFTWK